LLLRRADLLPTARRKRLIHTIRRPGPEWIASPAGQGFMSAQRRDHRSIRQANVRPRVHRCCGQHSRCAAGARAKAPMALQYRADASAETASPSEWDRMATNSLQSDRRSREDRNLRLRQRNASLENRIGCTRPAVNHMPQSPRPSPQPTSSPSRLHLTSPLIPAGQPSWAERYDGKRDLHLLHAA
jgi:hypothetical protein